MLVERDRRAHRLVWKRTDGPAGPSLPGRSRRRTRPFRMKRWLAIRLTRFALRPNLSPWRTLNAHLSFAADFVPLLMFEENTMTGSMPGIVSRRTALVLNAVIVVAYVTIGVLAPTPWIMFGGFLLLAVAIRCATLWWISSSVQDTEGGSPHFALRIVFLNLFLGLLFVTAVIGLLWWLGHYWLSGIKVIVPLVAVFVAYKSTFPVISWSSRSKDDRILEPDGAANGSQPIRSETNTTSSAAGSRR